MLREMIAPKELKWWDWFFSLPPIIAFYIGAYFATYFVALRDPDLEHQIMRYIGFGCIAVVTA